MYSQYISNFDNALKVLDESCKKNVLFNDLVKEFEVRVHVCSVCVCVCVCVCINGYLGKQMSNCFAVLAVLL